ncbi:MAG: M20/M25/M40 family metallo-hydrolase [Thermodesulfobacteriota bacterium]
MESARDAAPAVRQPVELLQQLIRFDTTNPPGNEAACIAFINALLAEAGIQTTILAQSPRRPNIVARLTGQGRAAPLLLYGHVDVVTTENQDWQQPPFSGNLVDGYVWGRGTLDMKSGVAMMLAAFLRAKKEKCRPPGDIILAVVSDEETGGDLGARYLVENHADLFKGVRYAIGEFGGFSLYVGGRRFYPVMVAEKQPCWMKAAVRGPGGHGSMPVRGGAMVKLSRMLQQLDRRRLPVHVTPVARSMLTTIAKEVKGIPGRIIGGLAKPALTDGLLNLMGERGRVFDPLLHNTVSPTVLHGSRQINVIPSEVSVELDGRLLPGYGPEHMQAELRNIIGSDVALEVIRYEAGPAEPDMGLFDTLAEILRAADPGGTAVPLLLSGFTDGRFFSRLGIQTYGFLPMKLPQDFNFSQTIHAANERIPADALDFGANAIWNLLQRFETCV